MKNIAIVCGGYSKESVISLRSAEQIASVIDSVYNIYTVYITRESWNAKIGDGKHEMREMLKYREQTVNNLLDDRHRWIPERKEEGHGKGRNWRGQG